jgi:hypothetical protein
MPVSRLELTLVATALLSSATFANAATIPLTLQAQPPHTLGPQSASAPCIIAGTNCKNPDGFGFTNFTQGGNISAFDEDSPTYSIDQFPFLSFDVAVDVNTNSDQGETAAPRALRAAGDKRRRRLRGDRNFTGLEIIGTGSSNGNGRRLTLERSTEFLRGVLVYFNAVGTTPALAPSRSSSLTEERRVRRPMRVARRCRAGSPSSRASVCWFRIARRVAARRC